MPDNDPPQTDIPPYAQKALRFDTCALDAPVANVRLKLTTDSVDWPTPVFRPGVFTPANSCQANSFEPAAAPAISKKPRRNPAL
jgi:hypothetical protein